MDGWLNLSLAMEGYLRAPDGRVRYIPGLEAIARDTLRAGVRVRWGRPLGNGAGCSYCWTRRIILAPWLFEEEGWFIRDVWSHELAHCVVGPSHQRACAWQQARYGELVSGL